MGNTPRELAYRILFTAEKDTSRYIDEILSKTLSGNLISTQEKRWVMELVYGVTRMKYQLDAWIQSAFKGRYHKAQHAIKVLLRIGTFQLKYMNTAEHAAIHETVKLSKKVKQHKASSLINAVLRNIQTLDLDKDIILSAELEDQLSIKTSHPEWMLSRWVSRYGMDDVLALCDHNNKSPKNWIRRNTRQVSKKDFEEYLSREDILFQQSSVISSFYEVDSAGELIKTKEFQAGWFSFQDLAAGIVASLVEPLEGDVVVDACAAPGGKMACIAEQYGEDLKHIYACDASETRLNKVRDTVKRLKLDKVTIIQLDAGSDKLPQANIMLLDVPCSGTGVLQRRADARWKRQPGDITSLNDIQIKIFMNSWKHLLPGGSLIYATCTLEPEENWLLVDQVISELENAEIDPIRNEKFKPYIDERGALATLPWRHDMDGMFAVKIKKIL